MKKSILSLVLAVAMLFSLISVPALAETVPTFRVQGRIVLPGTDVAPSGGLYVTIHYRSDKGTDSTTDYYAKNTLVVLMPGAHEAPFYFDAEYTASAEKMPRFTIEYSIPTGTKYWEYGYYSLAGTQYYKEGQTQFNEGAVSDIVITPVLASEISGTVSLPEYTANQAATEVEVIAKTTGKTTTTADDYTAKTNVSITTAGLGYKLRVPANVTTTDYIVMYKTAAQNYISEGYYTTGGTVADASAATKIDASKGNYGNINLVLIKKTTPTPTPTPTPDSDYDFNQDGRVDVRDMIYVTTRMNAPKKYDAKYDLNKDGVINVKDLKIIKEEIKDQKKLAHHEKKLAHHQEKLAWGKRK